MLIYGHFGAPEMGAAGAAIGTLVARMTELVVLIIYIIKKEKQLHLSIRSYLQHDRFLSGDYFRVTAPMLVVQGLWGVNTALQTGILGHMTAAAIAANSVASTKEMANTFLIILSVVVIGIPTRCRPTTALSAREGMPCLL